ncbi:MAG: DNA internalization-related competence protein ComEC/Rec2 [Candidatus Tectomicrobia bacterium]|nr:DNA internalization-related competence protein ComEC/Rec2 [Candidatus Tectomicrobia bacterium]
MVRLDSEQAVVAVNATPPGEVMARALQGPLARMLAVLGGVVAGILLAGVALWWLAIPALALLPALLGGRRATPPWRRPLALLILLASGAALLGGSRSWWTAAPRSRQHLLHHLRDARADLYGRVVAPPTQRREAVLVTLEAERLVYEGKSYLPSVDLPVSGRVLLKVYETWAYVHYGDRIVVRGVMLRKTYRSHNPGEFNYQRYLGTRGIFVRGGATSWLRVDLLERGQGTQLGLFLAAARRRIEQLLSWQVARPTAGVMRAILFSDRGQLTRTHEENLTKSGLAHLLAVSGLHVGFVGVASYGVVRLFLALLNGCLVRRWAWCVSSRRVAAFAALWPMLFYAALVGFQVSTTRALLMGAAFYGAHVVDRQRYVFHSLALAGLVVLLWMPGSVYEAGFQLSFGAVAGIAVALRLLRLREARNPFRQAGLEQPRWWSRKLMLSFLVSLAAWLATLPILAYHFGVVYPWSLPANLLAVPLASLAVPSGLLGAMVGLLSPSAAWLPLQASALCTTLLLKVSELAPALPGAVLHVVTPSLAVLALAYLGLGLLSAAWVAAGRAARMLRCGGVAALAAMLLLALPPYLPRRATGLLRVAFLNVGQGDAAVAELPDGRVLLVDAGSRWKGGDDAGAAIVAPYLRARGIRRLDVAVATHRDGDHTGGLPFLIERYGVREVWTNTAAPRSFDTSELEVAARQAGARLGALRAGMRIPLGEATYVAVLSAGETPPPHDRRRLSDENHRSLVLRLVFGGASVLFTSDIGAETERWLLASSADLASTILKVPHHGSRTSSTAAFLDVVRPRAAVVSAGLYNRYGHPAPSVVRRYAEHGIPLYTTAAQGAIVVETDGRTLRLLPTVPRAAPQVEVLERRPQTREPLVVAGEPGSSLGRTLAPAARQGPQPFRNEASKPLKIW